MPAPVVTRLNTITYAGVAVGAATNYQLHDVHVLEKSYERITVTFDVLVRDTTTANMKTLAAALEAAYRTPDSNLTVNLGGEDFFAGTQVANTIMNAQPSIELLREARSNKSRLYRCSVTGMLSADLAGKNSRRTSRFDLQTDDVGIRTVTFTASYTASPSAGAGAYEQATNYFEPWAISVRDTLLGGVWDELVARSITRDDDNDKTATATVTYREVIFAQSSDGTNDTTIVDPHYDFVTHRTAMPQYPGGASEPVAVTVAFNLGVRKSVTQDLKAVVQNKVKPYLRGLVATQTDAPSAPVAVEESITTDPINNRVRGAITYVCLSTSLVRMSLRRKEHLYTGKGLVPVLDGKPFSRDLHPGPGARILELTLHTIEIAGVAESGEDISQKPFTDAVAKAEGQGFVLQDQDAETERFARTLPQSGDSITFLERVRVAVLEYAEQSTDGAPSSGDEATVVRGEERGPPFGAVV